MISQRSIAYPIIILIIFLVSLTSLLHYFIQVKSLETTFLSSNIGKAEQIHLMIQSLINKETDNIEVLSQSLQENEHLGNRVAAFIKTGARTGLFADSIERIYKGTGLNVLEVIDKNGLVIYPEPDSKRDANHVDYWGVDEALDGRSIVTTSYSAEGWGIRGFVPVFDNGAVLGTIMIGTLIDDTFARKMSEATGEEISIGSVTGLIASSISREKRVDTDFQSLILSLTENRQITIENTTANTVVLYAPLWVVDEVLGFVVEIDTSDDALMIDKQQNQIFMLFIAILFAALLVGSVLTVYLIKPLNKLTSRAVETVRDISGDKVLVSKGNEITQLVQSFNVMLQKIMEHFAQQDKVKRELTQEKELMAVTLRSIGDGVITSDVEDRIQLFNEAAENIIGRKREEVIGKLLSEIYNTDDVTMRAGENSLGGKSKEKRPNGVYSSKSLFISPDGSKKIIFESGSLVHNDDGQIVGSVLVLRDITQQKQMEENRIRAHQLESLGTLAGGIAHDFNNILTAILGNADMAIHSIAPDNKAMKNLGEINKASIKAKDLTQKLLTFSKGGAPIRQAAVMDDLVRDSVNFILSGSNTRCTFSLPATLWPAYVDKGQISQVVQNLCLNAHEAMRESGEIEIRAENKIVSSEDKLPLRSGEYIKLTIADYGRGISPEDLPKIFEPYFTTKREGGGLGLSIVQSVIERHGGYISVESELGKGTSFTLYIPAIHEDITATEETTARVPDRGEGRILYMDDEEMLRTVVKEILEDMDYKVQVACDGEQAIKLFTDAKDSGKPFDLVILDLTIPGGLGGKETVRKLLAIDSSVRAIVASGYCHDPVLAEYKEFGFKGAMIKPFDTEKLNDTINKVFRL